MKEKINTIPEFYTILSDYFEKNENDLSSLTLKDIRFLLGQAFMLKLEDYAVHSVSLDEIQKKYPHFVNTYDGKDRNYAPGYNFCTIADIANSRCRERDFLPKHLENERLDCISTNSKILFVRSADFSDKYIEYTEDDSDCLDFADYESYVEHIQNSTGCDIKTAQAHIEMYGIVDDESLKDRQERIFDEALDMAFREFGAEATFTLKTDDFEYTIYGNDSNEEFLKLANGEKFQGDFDSSIIDNEEVPKNIRNFLEAWETTNLTHALELVNIDLSNNKIKKQKQ